MFVKKFRECEPFIANDGCLIRELLHPKNDPYELPYSIAYAQVVAGKHTYKHLLKQTEVYFIISGQGQMHINEEEQDVSTGDTIYIPENSTQWLANTGREPLVFLAIVNPPWNEADDIRLET